VIGCFWIKHIGIACARRTIPSLTGLPLALAGSDNRLVVVSEEAQAVGIVPGHTTTAAKALCPLLAVVPYDRPAYEREAQVLWSLYAEESSRVEPVSPEYCFVELEGFSPYTRAEMLAQIATNRVGAAVAVGLGRTRFIAHHAALRATPPLPLAIELVREHTFLDGLPITVVPNLDPKTHGELRRLGMHRFRDLSAIPRTRLPKRLKPVWDVLSHYAAGGDTTRVARRWPPPAIVHSQAFEEETASSAVLTAALHLLAEAIARDLAAAHTYCREMILVVSLSHGHSLTASETLKGPEADATVLARTADRLLARLALAEPVIEVSLTADGLGAGSGLQRALFDPVGGGLVPFVDEQAVAATRAVLTRRFGSAVVQTVADLYSATQAGCFTYTLGVARDALVSVQTDATGTPTSFRAGRLTRQIAAVQDRWREEQWLGTSPGQRTIYRVHTDTKALYELEHQEDSWRLRAVAD
jgi:DNA polymerase-4